MSRLSSMSVGVLTAVFVLGCDQAQRRETAAASCGLKATPMTFAGPLINSSLVSLLFQLTDCNKKPVAGITQSQVSAVEISGSSVNVLSPTETHSGFRRDSKAYGMIVELAIDFSRSIYGNADPQLVNKLRQTVITFGKRLLTQNVGQANPTVVLYASAFDGLQARDPIMADTTTHSQLFTDPTVFETQINAQLQCSVYSPLRTSLCVDGSTNLYGATISSVQAAAVDPFSPNNVYRPDYTSRVVVVFTDGRDEANLHTLTEVQNTMTSNADVRVYTVGLRGEVDENALNKIGVNGTYWADNVEGLQTAFDNLESGLNDLANSFYLFQYCTAKRSGSIRMILGSSSDMQGRVSVSDFNSLAPSMVSETFNATSAYQCPL